jgi:type I restriction enzyme S subunit
LPEPDVLASEAREIRGCIERAGSAVDGIRRGELMNKVNLPEGWCLTTLGNVVELKYGKSLPASKRDNGKFLVFGSNGIVGSHSEPLVKTEGIIVGRKGSYGEVHLSNSPFFPIDTTYYVDNLFSQPLKYWFYQLKTLPLTELNRSAAIPGLNREDAYSQFYSTSSASRTKMIADKLDVCWRRCKLPNLRLERILKILKTFRQSASAQSGKLTEEWRVTNTKVVGEIKP